MALQGGDWEEGEVLDEPACDRVVRTSANCGKSHFSSKRHTFCPFLIYTAQALTSHHDPSYFCIGVISTSDKRSQDQARSQFFRQYLPLVLAEAGITQQPRLPSRCHLQAADSGLHELCTNQINPGVTATANAQSLSEFDEIFSEPVKCSRPSIRLCTPSTLYYRIRKFKL
jgi:hypothetical protein